MQRREYFPFLDALRGLSFIGIFILHASQPMWDNSLIDKFLHHFRFSLSFSIDVFFILSSFLLTYLGLREFEKHGRFSFKNYFLRRALRIWPLYYLIMVLSFLVIPLLGSKLNMNITFPDPWYYIFFVSNFYTEDHVFFLRVLWTLSVEEQFYLVLGLSLLFFIKRIFYVFILLLAFSLVYTATIYIKGVDGYYNTLTYLVDFSFGGFAAIAYYKRNGIFKWVTNLSKTRSRLFNSYLLIHFFIFFFLFSVSDSPWLFLVNRYLVIVYISLLILKGVELKNWPVFRSRFLIYTGKISYGLYCFHGAAITFFIKLLPERNIGMKTLTFIITLLATYMLAILSYELYEKPFLRLKEKFRGKNKLA